MGLLKAEPVSCSESCTISSHGENQVVDIKVEDDVCIEEVEDPLPIIDPAMQAENQVGFFFVSVMKKVVHIFSIL